MPECPTCRTALADGLPVCPHDGTPLRPAGTLEGQVLGERYRVIGSLGEGGMGNVYLTEHVVLGKRFAVKVLRPELSARPDLVTRFQQEAISASRIGTLCPMRIEPPAASVLTSSTSEIRAKLHHIWGCLPR